jgi:hypothetical protein
MPIEQQEVMPVQTSQTSPPSAQPMQLPEIKTHFSVDIAYVFVGKGPSEAPHSHFDGVLQYPESQYPSVVFFNVTSASIAKSESCDALIEVYLVQITSDKGSIESYAYFEGTNYEPSFSDSKLELLTTRIYDLIDPSAVNGVRGHFRFNWTNNEAVLGGKVGSFGSYSSRPSGLGLWSAGKPNTISVAVCRIGFVTINDDFISVRADAVSADNMVQVQLQNFGEGFLYNKIVPADKLLQIELETDLFQPLGLLS